MAAAHLLHDASTFLRQTESSKHRECHLDDGGIVHIHAVLLHQFDETMYHRVTADVLPFHYGGVD